MFDISGKIACVTGASSGIGAATAEALAEAGCNLVLSARREDKIKDFAEYLTEKYGIKCFGGVLDVRNQKDVEKFFAKLPKAFKNIEILVNNAGLAKDMTPLYDNKISDWEQMIDTNVKGLLYVTKAVLPGMVKRDRMTRNIPRRHGLLRDETRSQRDNERSQKRSPQNIAPCHNDRSRCGRNRVQHGQI